MELYYITLLYFNIFIYSSIHFAFFSFLDLHATPQLIHMFAKNMI